MEFHEAHLKMMKDMSKLLILIIYGGIHGNELDDELKFNLKNNTYLSICNKWVFFEEMKYTIPEKPICIMNPELPPVVQLTYQKIHILWKFL